MVLNKPTLHIMLAWTSFCGARNHWICYLVKLGGSLPSFRRNHVSRLLPLFRFRWCNLKLFGMVLWTDNLLAQLFLTQCRVLLLPTGWLLLLILGVLSHAFGRYLIQAVQVRVTVSMSWWHCAPGMLRAIKEHVVWNASISSWRCNDMASRRRCNHNRLTTINIDLKSSLLLSSGGCDMTKWLFLLALDWSRYCLLHNGLLLVLLCNASPIAHHDSLLVYLHGWGRRTEDELVLAEDRTGSSWLCPIVIRLLPTLCRIRSWWGRRFKKLITAQVQTLLTTMANLVSRRSLINRGSLARPLRRWTLQPLLLLVIGTLGTARGSSPN